MYPCPITLEMPKGEPPAIQLRTSFGDVSILSSRMCFWIGSDDVKFQRFAKVSDEPSLVLTNLHLCEFQYVRALSLNGLMSDDVVDLDNMSGGL